jgi:inner membrane protein
MLGSGVHATLPGAAPSDAAARIDFELELPLQGTGELRIAPIGDESRLHIASDWPHPSFIGDFLPVERKIGARGFEARWQTSLFATNMVEIVQACAKSSDCRLKAPQLGVSIVDPVDQYLKTERAIKYALLFIALTFAGVFLCEILGRMTVHTMHYGLVGLTLALFFLLLLSTSEHIGFGWAYGLSAAASVGLLSTYIGSILRSRRHGLAFFAALTALYAMLYALLGAEDYALLMGSMLLFALLGGFMMATRRVDWSRLGATEPAQVAP